MRQLDFGQMFINRRNSDQSGSQTETPFNNVNNDYASGSKDTARFEEDVSSDLQMFLTRHGHQRNAQNVLSTGGTLKSGGSLVNDDSCGVGGFYGEDQQQQTFRGTYNWYSGGGSDPSQQI